MRILPRLCQQSFSSSKQTASTNQYTYIDTVRFGIRHRDTHQAQEREPFAGINTNLDREIIKTTAEALIENWGTDGRLAASCYMTAIGLFNAECHPDNRVNRDYSVAVFTFLSNTGALEMSDVPT